MPGIIGIVGHTPAWVFAVLAVLAVLGLQSLRPRTVPIRRLLIVPAVFIVWGIISLATRAPASPALIVDWLATAAVGMALAWPMSRVNALRIDAARGLVAMPGSVVPLARNLTIFLVKYCLGVAAVLAPAWHGQLAYWDIAASGLSAGYFMGFPLRFAIKYRSVTQPQAAGVSAK
jgi:hypothetical protein